MAYCNVNDENARLEALYRYDVLDSEPEPAFDRITRLVRAVLQIPMVMVSLVDERRQWFKSRQGLSAVETPREIAFCSYAIAGNRPLIVQDAQADPRFARNPLVVGKPHMRFYVGVPLRTPQGHNIGTLCAMDTKVRELCTEQINMLEDLAQIVIDELELRRLASTDSLTGALTRRSLVERARHDTARCAGDGRPLSCAVLDIDNFKSINDTYGHAVGDLLLTRIAARCAATSTGAEYVGRIGGDEFVLMLPDTVLLDAFEIADRLRRDIAAEAIEVAGERIFASVSIGIAELTGHDGDFDRLLRDADAALHDAKLDGKHRVACHLADLGLASEGQFDGPPTTAPADGVAAA